MKHIFMQHDVHDLIRDQYHEAFGITSYNRIYQDLRVPLWYQLAINLIDRISE